MKESIKANFEQEMETTRRFFDVISNEFFEYQPHEKSMNAGNLMNHIAMIPAIVPAITGGSGLDFAQMPPSEPAKNKEEMIALFEKNVESAKNALDQLPEADLTQEWTLKNGDAVYVQAAKQDAMRNLIISHTIHHRAQLGVYLRMNNLKVPASYVASADESLI